MCSDSSMFDSPSWARTNDTAVNSRVLCQLSYGGMSQILFSIRYKTTVCSLLILIADQIPFSLCLKLVFGNDERLDLNLTSRVGVYLSSRTVSSQVFSARQSLTSVFGMGTGGPSAYFTPTSSHLHLQGLEPWTH